MINSCRIYLNYEIIKAVFNKVSTSLADVADDGGEVGA
jgi:hypothetical protein